MVAAAGSRGIKNLISLKQHTSTTSSQNQSTQQACLRKNQSEHAFLIRLSIHGTQRLNCFNLYSAKYTARILHEWNLECSFFTLFTFTTISANSAKITDYGRPMKLFPLKSQIFGLGQIIWADKFWGIWGILGQFISTHFGTVSPLSMFSINQPLFLQKTKPLYPNPKYLFGIGI